MSKKTIRFSARVAAVALFLGAFLLLDALLSGTLSVLGALCLMPAALVSAVYLFRFSARPVRKRRVRHIPQPPVKKMTVVRPAAVAAACCPAKPAA